MIAFLDAHLKKDDLADGLEKFEEFEDFQRLNGMNVTEYIASFDSRYRKIEKLKTENDFIMKMKKRCWRQAMSSSIEKEKLINQEETDLVMADHAQHSNMNPLGLDGKPLTCRCCGSYRHSVVDCPHNKEVMDEHVCKTDARDETILL